MMTRQERTLRKAVVILAAATLLLGILLIWSLRAGRDVGNSGQNGESPEVASVGGQSVKEQQWLEELKNKHGDEVLLGILNHIAVEKEAKRLGIHVTENEIEQELRNTMAGYSSEEQYYAQMQTELGLSRQEVRQETVYRLTLQAIATSGIIIQDADIDEYLKENEDRYRPKKVMKLSMIKVRTYSEADEVMDRLDRGEDFGTLAKDLSIDEESSQRGGSLGDVEEDDPFFPEEMLKTASELDAGDIAGPLQADDSYVIIRVEQITSPELPSDKELKAQVRREMALERAEPLQQVESDLRTKYDAAIYIDNRPQD